MTSNSSNRNGHRHPKKKQKLSTRSIKSNSSSSSIEILNPSRNHLQSHSNHNINSLFNHKPKFNQSTNDQPSFYDLPAKNGNVSIKKSPTKSKKRTKHRRNSGFNLYANTVIPDHNGSSLNHNNRSTLDNESPIPWPQEKDRRSVHPTDDYNLHNISFESFNTDSSAISFSRKSKKSRYDSFNDRYQ